MKRKAVAFILGFMLLLQTESSFGLNYETYKNFLQGAFNLKTGHIGDGIKNYEKVIALDKNAFSVYKDLAYLYWQSVNAEKAFQITDKINKFDDENPQTTIFLATFYLIANNPEISKYFWEKTIKLDPENETVTAYLAVYYNSDNIFKESIDYRNKFLKQQPDNAAGYFQIGMIQEKLAMNDAALVSYNKVIKLNPDARDAYIAKARIYEATGKFNSAIKEYEKYISAFPDNTLVLIYLGKCYYKTQNYTKAEEIFIKIKKIFPDDPTIRYWLGIIYEKTGHIDKAATEFEKLALKKEKNVPVLTKLGYYYSILKDYQKSEKIFLKALDIERSNNEILYLTALNYMDWKKYNKAIEYFNKIIELTPDFADAYFYLGSAYDKHKDFENTEKALLKAIKINPEHSRAMNYLGYTYAEKGIKLNEAEALLVKSVTLKPKNGAYLDSLGWLYYKQGKFDTAERLLLSAANFITDPLIYDHLGDVYSALGRITEAWTAYALSHDFKQDKNVKKKLDFVQTKIPQEELSRQMLLRSESNYTKMFSFKTGYKIKLNSKFLSKNVYIPFSYTKDGNIKLDFPAALVPGGATISIKNRQAEILPKAIEKEIPQILLNIISQICKIFDGSFYKQFAGAKVTRNGKNLTYQKDNAELTLNMDTALIERFSQNNITIQILKYDNLHISKIPSKIKFNSSDMKIKGISEATKIFILTDSEKE